MQAIRRSLAFTCLLAALAGPLLVQAEVAEGLGRSLAELTARGVIEPADRDAGTDLGASSLKTSLHPGFDPSSAPAATPGDILPAPASLAADHALLPRLLSAQDPLSPSSRRRQAQLQRFRC